MNIWENAVITQKGLALQSKLIAGNTLAITKVQLGAGAVSASLLYKQTAVQDVKKTLTQVTSVTYPEQGKCTIKINITNDDVTTGYTAMQLGFFANDPDEGEILYFIAQAESGYGTVVPSKTEMPGFSAEWSFTFQYGQADSVTVTVDPSNTVSQAEMEEYVANNAMSQEEVEEIVSEGFISKDGGTLTGPLYINDEVVLSGLKANDTVYVSPSGNDTTGDGTSTKPFLTIAKALTAVPKNLNGKTATISIAQGTYSEQKVNIAGFMNGELVLTGTSADAKPTIPNGVYVSDCGAAVILKNLSLSSSSAGAQAIATIRSLQITIDTCAVTSATAQQNHGILIDEFSSGYINNAHVSNCNYALLSRASKVFVRNLSGGGNRVGFYATNGGDIRLREFTTTADVMYFTEYGGRIYHGAQTSAPKY